MISSADEVVAATGIGYRLIRHDRVGSVGEAVRRRDRPRAEARRVNGLFRSR